MVSAKSSELPPGWTEHFKVSNGRKIKYYVNSENDKKFYSKLSVFRHAGAEDGSPSQDTPQQSNGDKKTSSETIATPVEMETSGSHEWLPPGWTMEVRNKKSGETYKCYIHNATGKKLYSKINVLRYIETEAGSPSHGTPHHTGQDNETSLAAEVTPLAMETPETLEPHQIGQDNETSLAAEVTPLSMKRPATLEWLPHDWIMELKTKKSGRKYKIYVDPKTGSKFYSKPEVLKYLKTANQNSGSSQLKKLETKSASNPHVSQTDGGKLEDSQDQKELKGMNCASIPKRAGLRNQSDKTRDSGELSGNTPIVKSECSQHVEMPKGTSMQKQTDLSKQSDIKPNMNELDRSTSPVKPEGAKSRKVQKLTNKKVVIERFTADGLPPGWIKEVKIERKANGTRRDPFYTDPVNGYVFRSQNDALRYLKTGDINDCAIKPKKREELAFLSEVASKSLDNDNLDGNTTPKESEGSQHLEIMKGVSTEKQTDLSKQQGEKPNMDKLDGGTSAPKSEGTQNREKLNLTNGQVVVERSTADGLPPGWIKEVKIEKRASGIRKDPFFTDPVSGYVFRSQKDALRFLNTGDIKQCANKPKKREELGFLSEGALESFPPADDTEDSEHKIKRQLFGGKENGSKVSLETPDIEHTTGKSPDESHDLSSPSPRADGSKKKQARKTVARQNQTVPARSTKTVQDEKLTESDNSKKQTSSTNSKRKNVELPLTRRSSKRFAGTNENETMPSPGNTNTVSENEGAHEVLTAEIPPGFAVPNGSERPSGQPVLEDHPLEQETKKKDQPFEQKTEMMDEENTEVKLHPFGDSWSDPCLEFAIKTLTGSLPDMDHMETDFPFTQQVDTSCPKVDSCLTLLDFSSPSSLQAKPVSVPQFDGTPSAKHPEVVSEKAPPQPTPKRDSENYTKLGWP